MLAHIGNTSEAPASTGARPSGNTGPPFRRLQIPPTRGGSQFLSTAWFEIRFWLRSWTIWVFLVVVTILVSVALRSEEFMTELGLSSIPRNAPFVLSTLYSGMGLLTLLMATIFVNSAALRDFSYNTHEMMFSLPLHRRDFLLGRFSAAILVSLVPMLGVSLGVLLARYVPGSESERWGAVNWGAHLKSVLLFALPDTFFVAAVLFAVTVIWRRDIASFVAAILLVLARSLTAQFFQDAHWETLRGLIDPFGVRALAAVTKYWSVADKGTLSPSFGGVLFWNRILWTAIGFAALALAYSRFSFTERRTRSKATESDETSKPVRVITPTSQLRGRDSGWQKLCGSFAIHFRGIAKDTTFVVIVLIAGVTSALVLGSAGTRFQENETYVTFPVTYGIIELIRSYLGFFLIVVITYFSGALAWKDREERMDEIIDATPAPEWVSYAARVIALVAMVISIEAVALLSGIITQAAHGYYRFQVGLYLHELLVRDASGIVFSAVLAFLIHALAPNKYLGYSVFIAFYFANLYIWRPFNVATNLVQFGGRPSVTYSDFFGDAPYREAWNWFTLYWSVFSLLLSIATVMFWPRGKKGGWQVCVRNAALRFSKRWKMATAACLLAFAGCGAWIWYNTKVLNPLLGPGDIERARAEYEKNYRPFARLPQPRVRSVKYSIDIFPSARKVSIRGDEVIQNPYSQPLTQIHFTLDPHYETSIDIPGATLAKADPRLSYCIYRLTLPLQPGEMRDLHFTVQNRSGGFENNVSNLQVVQNGTMISNLGSFVVGAHYLGPIIGYNYGRQLSDSTVRKKYGLPEFDLLPALERNCTDDCLDPLIPGHADWVNISATISTTPDQIAVAPGSLVREWNADGRRYFEYRLDHPSMSLYCFASARYQVAREEWNGVKLEVYYLREHAWNVPRMLDAMRRSLDYYTRNFGPYRHKQARIVEFPRVSTFAAEFPGTMPYSEAFGFIAKLDHPDDIDFVSYIVAHEMAHQWWDDQVAPANMEGASLLDESLAQYSAFMVMEKEYGRDLVGKFLAYERDGYLRARGQARLPEHPLLTVETQQPYIFYQKGGIALYYLKEMIGEDAFNSAIRRLVQRYGYAPPPYPTAYALLDELREEIPPNLQYLMKDLFEDITLFSNRTLSATAVKRADGKYEVTIKVEVGKFKADGKGNETEAPVNDWVEIGAFAKPADGKQYGNTLYRARVHFTERNSTLTFTTADLPEKAGIDPFALLIDRVPEDNLKNVTLESGTTQPGGIR